MQRSKAVEHSLDRDHPKASITITSRREGGRALLQVEDNGGGFPAPLLRDGPGAGQGIGLVNCQERLQLAFGPQVGLQLSNAPRGGARVRVLLPLPPPQPERVLA